MVPVNEGGGRLGGGGGGEGEEGSVSSKVQTSRPEFGNGLPRENFTHFMQKNMEVKNTFDLQKHDMM